MRHELPSGTVTFLFTDVEGSTRLLGELGAEGYAAVLAEHRRVVRAAFARHDGVEVDTQGDAFFVAFPTAPGALAAAREMTEALRAGPVRLRIGVHTGTPFVAEEGYVGSDVNRAARIAASGHGGQVLVSSSTAALVSPSGSELQALSLRDLGEHRLKDLSAPERIYQLGDGDFPPLATLHQTNLPVPTTPFLGREHELAEVVGLVAADDARLVTLTGPGGSGKTRLALQAAGALAERYPHGVFWVPLAPLRDPALVLESASQVLGAKNGLAEHIADRRLLLLFDNFEHVLAAADGLGELLAQCPGLEILVTSREPLHLHAEQTYVVPPLAHEEAVGFFAARARAADPAFEVDDSVSEICRRLDDLPLALELAAARVTALSPRQILERLERRLPLLTGGARDVPERQRTLRATIEWSYELLSPDEQRLFERLAVLRGGCTLQAAEAVCDADLDSLQSLVEKSLVRFSHERYWMLETIRELASEKLAEGGEAGAIARRHAEHFLALAEEADPHLHGGDSRVWVDRLEHEHDNLRSALDFFDASGEARSLATLAGRLTTFWYLQGHALEGRRRLDDALARYGHPSAVRVRGLVGVSQLAAMVGNVTVAMEKAEEALSLSREIGDEAGTAHSLWMLAYLLVEDGRPETAVPLLEDCARRFRDLGDEFNAGWATRTLAFSHEMQGDLERARVLHEENLVRARSVGHVQLQAVTLGALAMNAVAQGRPLDAFPLLRENLELFVELGSSAPLIVNVCRIAHALAAVERAAGAARVLAAARRLLDDLGGGEPWVVQMNDETTAIIREQLGPDALELARAEGEKPGLEDVVALARAALAGSVNERH